MYANAKEIVDSLRLVAARQQELGKLVLDKLKPTPGPYSLFHHHGHMIERLEDLALIVERIGRARQRVTTLHEREGRLNPKGGFKPGVRFPRRVQAILRERHQLTHAMRLDAESLYIFANMALDQWAYVVAYCFGLDDAENHSFHHLVNKLQSATPPDRLRTFAARHLQEALWLYYQLRFYRNNFIEHVRRPWQRGSNMSIYGEDFNFFIPSPPGWVPLEKEREMIDSIRPLAPQWLKDLPDDDWRKATPKALLEATYREIEKLPTQADRARVWDVWKELGGSVVSFDELGRRLVAFMSDTLDTVLTEVAARPQDVNVGPSPYSIEGSSRP